MGVYVVTGSASGMGASVAARLTDDGHEVIGVDLADAAVIADLSTVEGRRGAVDALTERIDGPLHGAVFAAGIGPRRGRERMLAEVNCLGVVELATALRPRLAAARNAKVVVFGSNSSTATPLVPRAAIRRLLDGDAEAAARILRRRPGALSGPAAYAASKIAVARWARRQAVTEAWAGAGIRMNVISPGPVMTPLLQGQLANPRSPVRSFPVPIRESGRPDQLAEWVMTMLSPAADFMVGSVVTVDGGTEALLRPNDWPSRLPGRLLPRMAWTMWRAPSRGQVADYS
ncbi:SDR family oxidoreductase [Gordonia humi]|uniref:NAD(P)-dependent dehydrogenase (Short-subunit alcohol dehydrogenase family) n=1 Tax=Gordonia humi TaxID=686429 RepID=A0A840F233_9ACTN|nr:SDR family oxidoreductase [Gordonia humi]MBB4133627.1 NAD(P)-dependent dehydrogenase (short-subunit alcohol dehydrogenase family) [Gordonia humi]